MKEIINLLRDSNIIPTIYIPEEEIFFFEHLLLKVNNSPLILIGLHDDYNSLQQANQLTKSKVFKQVCKDILNIGSNLSLEVITIKGTDIKWKKKEISISTRDGKLLWIVFGKKAISIAVSICIIKDLKRIVNLDL